LNKELYPSIYSDLKFETIADNLIDNKIIKSPSDFFIYKKGDNHRWFLNKSIIFSVKSSIKINEIFNFWKIINIKILYYNQ
jgi:hypothetical protein